MTGNPWNFLMIVRENWSSICWWLGPGHGDGAMVGACVHLFAYNMTLLIEHVNGKSVTSEWWDWGGGL